MRISNGFDIYKLKRAGMTNLSILRVLENNENQSLSQIAQLGRIKNKEIFIEKYKSLDVKKEKKNYRQFSSISILDSEYPTRLKEIYNPPVLLFYSGNIDLLQKPTLSFVGSRNASKIGIKTVHKLITELGNKFVIASGLATGIDTASHISTMKNKGKTIAVIGTGLDRYYPKENREIQNFIGRNHLLLTEYLPGESPKRFHFPERNRILAGIAIGVVVIEARIKSGSLITCQRALDEGRDIFAVPGNIIEGNSSGCNFLIQDGAKLINSGLDIILEYDF
ncbi:DNA protecting protein DprA [Floricoccus penangensis]|uniref:DNA protecting protein DprA n=1 Tax=Floricoccus penangensis TaxID=1859475 RepID=A0A9Q5JET2_9LACT|nr:DNA-processing protein DprA [Floricoccus penangensis]OFI46009.1 DNA protecting protein DprA [Floricoccus penangensis]